MRILQWCFLISIIVFSCRSEEVKKEEDCKIDSELVSQILRNNKHSVIQTYWLEELESKHGCTGLDTFLQYNFQRDIDFAQAKEIINDTLYSILEIESFEDLISKKENKGDVIIRVEKSIFAYGLSEILIVEAHQKKENVSLKSFKIHFDTKCNMLPYWSDSGLDFSSNCFKLLDTENKTISIQEWERFKTLIQETELIGTTYFDQGSRTCHAAAYSIDYSAGYSLEYGVRNISRACPGEKTAIYLVSEELIKMNDF